MESLQAIPEAGLLTSKDKLKRLTAMRCLLERQSGEMEKMTHGPSYLQDWEEEEEDLFEDESGDDYYEEEEE